MTVTLTVFPVTFRADVSRVDLAPMPQFSMSYCGQEGDHCKAERAGASGRVDLDALLGKELFCVKPGEEEGVTKEALLATPSLHSADRSDVAVSKKRDAELLRF